MGRSSPGALARALVRPRFGGALGAAFIAALSAAVVAAFCGALTAAFCGASRRCQRLAHRKPVGRGSLASVARRLLALLPPLLAAFSLIAIPLLSERFLAPLF